MLHSKLKGSYIIPRRQSHYTTSHVQKSVYLKYKYIYTAYSLHSIVWCTCTLGIRHYKYNTYSTYFMHLYSRKYKYTYSRHYMYTCIHTTVDPDPPNQATNPAWIGHWARVYDCAILEAGNSKS